MKSLRNRRHLPVWQILTALCLLFPSGKAAAQGEWRWANSWSGNDGSGSLYHNKVISSAFDDDGNIYIFGNFGGNATLHDQQGWGYICDSTVVIPPSSPAMMLAKFDTLGNLLWRKAFKIPGTGGITPHDMVLKDEVLHLTGMFFHDEDGFVQYWDTIFYALAHGYMPEYPYMIKNPPYTRGYYTYFANFDLDGNLLEDHFVGALPRIYNTYMGVVRQSMPLCYQISRMCVDSQGNTYLIADEKYYGREELPFYVVIDEDSARTYPLYFPGSSRDGAGIPNMVIYKFTPNWELAWAKPLIDHLELPSGELPLDSLLKATYYIDGFSIDQDDNLYVSGKIEQLIIRGHSAEYPTRFFMDDTHSLEITDTATWKRLAFVLKYDTAGNLLWDNQIFVRTSEQFVTAQWSNHTINDNTIYIMGNTGSCLHEDGELFYFDSEENHLSFDSIVRTGFIVGFDKYTGKYKYSGIPNENINTACSTNPKPAVIGDHVLGMFLHNAVYHDDAVLCQFDSTCVFKREDTLGVFGNQTMPQKVEVDDRGHILVDLIAFGNVSFGNDFIYEISNSGRSNALFAYRYDPSILEPFPDGIPSHTIPLQSLRLYPNPASTLVRIELPEGFTDYTVSLYDMQGHLAGIYRKDVIDVSALSPGIYTVNVLSAKESLSGKLVIER